MAYWLCDRRGEQDSAHIQRFDPRFWTVNFPRPMMAALTTTAPDALRVDAVFHGRGDLAGLIWESDDRWDHPLLGYATDRDYRRTTLRFRWRSSGLVPLDAVNGPTLTIEGRDAGGNARAWYVRLWNYAEGTPEDAIVTLPLGDLQGGFLLPAEADPVFAGDIDRMFVSLVPPGYDPSGGALPAPLEGWAELSGIACDGHRAMLAIGDVLVPPHGASLATAYDDSFNLAPARVLRMVRGLGYRGAINHYIGMSHYFQLARRPGGVLWVDEDRPLCTPCIAWHRDFADRAQAMGMTLILSLSYELFDAHCPEGWKQRDADGAPALTGWVPPSTLLSPASAPAMAWLQGVARAFVAILVDAGLPVHFQVGEPWWWVFGDGRICLYDDAASIALSPPAAPIRDVRAPLDSAQRALLDRAGALLAASTAALGAAVRAQAGGAGAELLLLVYLPSVLDPAASEVARANAPAGWAFPAFDVLQLEDYDWAAAGNVAAQERALAQAQARWGYDAGRQHYLAGFVLRPEDRAQWDAIDAALVAARRRGVAAHFVWAMPQVARDGYVHFRISEEDAMQPFDDVVFPLALGEAAEVSPAFATDVLVTASGHERRNSRWSDALLSFDAGPGVRSEEEMRTLIAFFRARRGQARGFRFADPTDSSSAADGGAPGPLDQLIGTGDGSNARFALVKRYGEGADAQVRRITRPRPGTVRASIDGSETSAFRIEAPGILAFDAPPPAGATVRAGFRFDVPVRFATDRLALGWAAIAAGDIPSVPLVEVREAG